MKMLPIQWADARLQQNKKSAWTERTTAVSGVFEVAEFWDNQYCLPKVMDASNNYRASFFSWNRVDAPVAHRAEVIFTKTKLFGSPTAD